MSRLGHIPDWPRCWLEQRHLPWHLAVLAMLLCAPSLWLGRQFDDDFHRAALTTPELPTISRSPAELFVFIEGDEAANLLAMKMGMLPWWSHRELRLAFFRPLTGLTHWIDYKRWPELPALMHLHSLIWFGGVIAAAAFFYRRMLASAWVAGLAALLFAVDDAHGLPAAWLANRNALIGVLFGLLTLIAYDRWCRNGWRMGVALAPLAFLCGLLAKESTLAIGAYLFAYVLFLDRAPWIRRFGSLLPCAVIGLIWWVVYRALGCGAVGSAWYLDPATDPLSFAEALAMCGPLLLAWQGLIPSDLQWELSQPVAQVLWLMAMGLLVTIVLALAPLLRRDALARFWALGIVLSVLPACGAYPADRLLFFVGIGGVGLLAPFIAAVVHNVDCPPLAAWRHSPGRVLCIALVFIHLGMAPVALARTSGNFKRYGRAPARTAAGLPSDTAARFQTVLIVNFPTYAAFTYCALNRSLYGPPYLSHTLVLGSGRKPIEIRRPDEHTLLIRPEEGYLAPVGNPHRRSEMAQILLDQRHSMETLDQFYRDGTPTAVGSRTQLMCATLEITAITEDSRPVEAPFHFVTPLENPPFRCVHRRDTRYVPFGVPTVGQTLTLPADTVG